MSDDSQWRDKYRDALSRLSAEETRRSRLQSVLRLLIGRLCLAGQGRDARLDAELLRVADTVRKGIDPKGLEELLDPLTQAVTMLDPQPAASQAPVPEPAPAGSADSTLSLLDQLALLPELRPMIAQLRADVAFMLMTVPTLERSCAAARARHPPGKRTARRGATREART